MENTNKFTPDEIECLENTAIAYEKDLEKWEDSYDQLVELAEDNEQIKTSYHTNLETDDDDDEINEVLNEMSKGLSDMVNKLQQKKLKDLRTQIDKRNETYKHLNSITRKIRRGVVEGINFNGLTDDIKSNTKVPPTRMKTSLSLIQIAKLLMNENSLFSDDDVNSLSEVVTETMAKVFEK